MGRTAFHPLQPTLENLTLHLMVFIINQLLLHNLFYKKYETNNT